MKPFTLVQGPPGKHEADPYLANFSISLLTEKVYFAMLRITNAQGPVSRKPTETFRARKAIFNSSVSKNGEVHAPETSCMKKTSVYIKKK